MQNFDKSGEHPHGFDALAFAESGLAALALELRRTGRWVKSIHALDFALDLARPGGAARALDFCAECASIVREVGQVRETAETASRGISMYVDLQNTKASDR